jgi:hypothetical protein
MYTKAGKIEKSDKLEAFNSLIVDVAQDIYSSLDMFFSSSKVRVWIWFLDNLKLMAIGQVDVENTTADRELSIVELPQCLLLQINVRAHIQFLWKPY